MRVEGERETLYYTEGYRERHCIIPQILGISGKIVFYSFLVKAKLPWCMVLSYK